MPKRGSVYLGIALIVIATLSWWIYRLSSPRPEIPVIIYLVDTLRADRLGAYGFDEPSSPHIDALAAESVVFERAYAPAPWTLPSVASLITSVPVCEHGVLTGQQKLNTSYRTLAELLKSVGYTTALRTRNAYTAPNFGLSRGYDFVEWPDQEKAEEMSAQVARLLDEEDIGTDRPFFLYLHTIEPHEWFQVPGDLLKFFGFVSVDERKALSGGLNAYNRFRQADWESGRTVGSTDNSAQQTEVIEQFSARREAGQVLYKSAVRWADNGVGDIVHLLKERGVWDRAIFVFLSDHGEEFGEHGAWFHDQSVYEELLHVPLIVHFPGDRFAGTRVSQTVLLLDVMPTLLDYLGLSELCSGCRGSSLLPLLDGEPAAEAGDVKVVGVRMNRKTYYRPRKEAIGDVNVAVRQGNWKAIWNAEPGTVELYDLQEDPGELSDRSANHPELGRELQDYAQAWFQSCQAGAQKPNETGEIDTRTRQRLRALGYFE